jgi:hypothetical protein
LTATVDTGTGTGNTLSVNDSSTVTLAQTGGSSHTINVATVNVTTGGTLLVADPTTAGDIEVNSGCTAVVEAASTVTTLHNNGTADIEAPSTITTLTGNGTTEFTGGAGASTIGTATAASGTVKMDTGATVSIDNASTIGTLNLTGGTAKLVQSGTHHLNTFTALSITSSGFLDVGSQNVLTNTAPDTIRDYIATGYNASSYGAEDGNWAGTGISSILAKNYYVPEAGVSKYAVGYAYGGDASVTDQQGNAQGNGNFNLDGVGPNDTLIRPCLTGDVNMDGVCDFNDIQAILGYHFNDGQPGLYTQGDLANHGIVNGDDIQFVLSANYNTLEYF